MTVTPLGQFSRRDTVDKQQVLFGIKADFLGQASPCRAMEVKNGVDLAMRASAAIIGDQLAILGKYLHINMKFTPRMVDDLLRGFDLALPIMLQPLLG